MNASQHFDMYYNTLLYAARYWMGPNLHPVVQMTAWRGAITALLEHYRESLSSYGKERWQVNIDNVEVEYCVACCAENAAVESYIGKLGKLPYYRCRYCGIIFSVRRNNFTVYSKRNEGEWKDEGGI